MRQQRLMTGKERDRVERVWLVTDEVPLSTLLLREYEGTHIVRASSAAVRELLAAGRDDRAGGVRLAGRPDGKPDAALAAGS